MVLSIDTEQLNEIERVDSGILKVAVAIAIGDELRLEHTAIQDIPGVGGNVDLDHAGLGYHDGQGCQGEKTKRLVQFHVGSFLLKASVESGIAKEKNQYHRACTSTDGPADNEGAIRHA